MRGQFLHSESVRTYLPRITVPSDNVILAWWMQGLDSFDIAAKFFIHESEIANRLTRIRMKDRDQ